MFSDEIYEQVFPHVEEPKQPVVTESMIQHVDETTQNKDQVDKIEQDLIVSPPAEQAQNEVVTDECGNDNPVG